MKKQPLVSVLILTYNHIDLLKNCLDSVLKSDYSNLEFIVSDNGSSEDIKGFVRKNYPKKIIKVVRLKDNKGLTGGFNFGYKFCKGKYIMILSNDTKIQNNAISQMVSLVEQDAKIGIVSPKIIQMKNIQNLHHAGSFMTYSGLLYHYGLLQDKDNKLYQKSYYIYSCNGAGFLIRKQAVQTSGLFEEDFFICYDESDLSHRIWLAGYTVVYCPQANLWHLWNATIGENSQLWYYNHRNHLSSFIRNLSAPYLFILLFNFNLILIIWFFMNIIKLRFDLAIVLPKVYFWQLIHIKQNLIKRKIIQSQIRKVTDNEIFSRTLISPSWRYYFIHLHLIYKDNALPKRVLYSQNNMLSSKKIR